MRSISVQQRRARLGRRHGLATQLPNVASVADALVALHATDPASIYLSAMARLVEPSLDAVANALYEQRSVVRTLAMRRTLFVASLACLPILERSSGETIALKERRRLERFLLDGGVSDPSTWLNEAAKEIERVIPPEGLLARKITSAVPMLSTKIVMGAGTKNEAVVGATSRVLGVLANEGLLLRGRPNGAWTGRQYHWHLREDWLQGGLVSHEATRSDSESLDAESASAALIRRWLTTFGPAPVEDMKWWTGWTVAKLRTALQDVDTVEVDLDGQPGLLLAEDLDDDPEPDTWVALLPSLDPTPMGWSNRDWFLGPHQDRLFDRNGNIGPTIWIDGRIVGGWGQHPDGAVVTSVLETIGSDHAAMIEDRASNLTDLLGGTAVKPSFPTPLQRELAG